MHFRVLLLVLAVAFLSVQLALQQADVAEPIQVRFEGTGDVAVVAVRPPGVPDEIEVPQADGTWRLANRWIVDIGVIARDSEPPKGVFHVAIGNRAFSISSDDLIHGNDFNRMPESVRAETAPWSQWAPVRNWPGTLVFLGRAVVRARVGLLFVLALSFLVLLWRKRSQRGLEAVVGVSEFSPTSGKGWGDRVWNLLGCAFLIGGFIGLEWIEPYYFTQDDALIGELPGILLGFRSLWDGVYPHYNPYIFLGAPFAENGFWSITYPPQWLAYAIARHVLNDEFATMEVFAAIHLAVGFIAMRYLGRRLGMAAMPANLAAVAFVFSGSILIMGRSWHAFLCFAVWLPILGLGIEQLRRGPVGWKWAVSMALVLGLSYHAGFPQITATLGAFFLLGLCIVAWADRLPLSRLAPAGPAILLGIGLAAPLLVLHLNRTVAFERLPSTEAGVWDALPAAYLPFPMARAELPTNWGSHHIERMGHFYYFGGLLALLFTVQAVAFWILWPDRSAWARNWWIPCAMLIFLLVLGDPALLWQTASKLPMSRFFLRYTIRFYPVLVFLGSLSGGMVLTRFLNGGARFSMGSTPSGTRLSSSQRIAETLVALVGFGLIVNHLAMCRPSFYSYGFRPYPPLPPEFNGMMADRLRHRLAWWAQARSPSPDYYLSLVHNLPSYYQIPCIFGYDPIVEGQPNVRAMWEKLRDNPKGACRAYGLVWHLISYRDKAILSPNPRIRPLEVHMPHAEAFRGLAKEDLQRVADVKGTTLFRMNSVDPLAFVVGRSDQPLGLHLHCGGADVDVRGVAAGEAVTLNFLWYPDLRLHLDGEPLDVEKDEWLRVRTVLPRPGTVLTMRFVPAWPKALSIGTFLSIVAVGWLLFLESRRRRNGTMTGV